MHTTYPHCLCASSMESSFAKRTLEKDALLRTVEYIRHTIDTSIYSVDYVFGRSYSARVHAADRLLVVSLSLSLPVHFHVPLVLPFPRILLPCARDRGLTQDASPTGGGTRRVPGAELSKKVRLAVLCCIKPTLWPVDSLFFMNCYS